MQVILTSTAEQYRGRQIAENKKIIADCRDINQRPENDATE